MAKSLGQIHTLTQQYTILQGTADPLVAGVFDIPKKLTEQLQRMVRQGNFFKVVGIDMKVNEYGGVEDAGGQISGYLRYWAPTRQRCAAYRNAWDACKTAMRLQGIDNPAVNKQYDFRVAFSDSSAYALTNQANLSGDDENGLVMQNNNGNVPDSSNILKVYNQAVQPVEAAAAGDLFQSGFNTMGVQDNPTDFVLNDGTTWEGNEDYASMEWEYIPFQLSYSPGSTDVTTTLQWRPDPALYLAVMLGQFEVYIDEYDLDDSATGLKLTMAVHVSGWKSIMGNPDKKRKSHGRRRRKHKK